MKKYIMLFVSAFLFIKSAYSQSEFGVNYQYSVGKSFNQNSFGLSYEGFSVKNSWTFGINYDLSSFGSNKASGFDVYAGYRHGFSYGSSGNLLGGLRTSFSFNKDKNGRSFTTFTPSVEAGYHYTFNHFGQGGFATPSLGVGYNFTLNKKEKIEQTPVLNVRMGVGYRF